MKIRLRASAFSNVSYDREEVVDSAYTEREWEGMSEAEQQVYLNELAEEFVWDDIDSYAAVIKEEDDA